MGFELTGGSWGVNEGDTSPPIKIGTGLEISSPPAVLAFAQNQRGELRTSKVAPQLTTGGGKPGEGYAAVFCTTGDITHALTHEGADASEDGTGRGTPIVAYGRSSFGGWDGAEVIAPVCSHDAKETTSIVLDQQLANGSEVAATLTVAYADKHGLEDQHVNSGCPLFVLSSGQANASVNKNISPTLDVTGEPPIAFNARPRRLTPKECERLMSWPDQWTAIGRKDDGTEYALSDTARYRLCGNGVGSVCAEWIGRRLVEAVTAQGAA
jgi:DNA (cytosine-5)-methyltransferase 1